MTDAVLQAAHTKAIVAALQAGGLRVGEGTDADGVGWQEWSDGPTATRDWLAYVVVFPLAAGVLTDSDSPIGKPETEGEMWWQITCVAPTQPAAEELVDAVTARMTRANITVAGRHVTRVRRVTGSVQVRRDDDVEPGEVALFYSTPQFRVWSTPA